MRSSGQTSARVIRGPQGLLVIRGPQGLRASGPLSNTRSSGQTSARGPGNQLQPSRYQGVQPHRHSRRRRMPATTYLADCLPSALPATACYYLADCLPPTLPATACYYLAGCLPPTLPATACLPVYLPSPRHRGPACPLLPAFILAVPQAYSEVLSAFYCPPLQTLMTTWVVGPLRRAPTQTWTTSSCASQTGTTRHYYTGGSSTIHDNTTHAHHVTHADHQPTTTHSHTPSSQVAHMLPPPSCQGPGLRPGRIQAGGCNGHQLAYCRCGP